MIFSKFLAVMFVGGAISHDAPTGLSLELKIISRWKKTVGANLSYGCTPTRPSIGSCNLDPQASLVLAPLKSVWHLYAFL